MNEIRAHKNPRDGATGWFDPDQVPARPGVYECVFVDETFGVDNTDEWVYFNKWNGREWCSGQGSPERAAIVVHHYPISDKLVRWRGLTASAYRRFVAAMEAGK